MIWFKNIHFYPLAEPVNTTWETLEEQLEAHAFVPCPPQKPFTLGWVSPIPGGQTLVHVAGDCALICCQRQERLLPGSVVNESLQEKIDHIKHAEDRRVSRKEKQSIKDELIFELLPKAFVRTTQNHILLNFKTGLVAFNCASENRADELNSFLREAMGSLPCLPMANRTKPSPVLAQWLKDTDSSPEGFQIEPDIELSQQANSDAKIKLKNVDLDGEELAIHMAQEVMVKQVALEWKEKLTFVLNDKCQVKRVKFSELLTQAADDQGADDLASQYDATFAIMSAELLELYADLQEHFGITPE